MAIKKEPKERITFPDWQPPDAQEDEMLEAIWKSIRDEGRLILKNEMIGHPDVDAYEKRVAYEKHIQSLQGRFSNGPPLTAAAANAIHGTQPSAPWNQTVSASTPIPSARKTSWGKTLESNIHEFSRIKDKKIIDIGVVGPEVFISLADGGVLIVMADARCEFSDQGNLSSLNGHPLGDIAVNPHYSIAGRMKCSLSIYSRHGHSINLAVFADAKPDFKLKYRQP
jgi:hypothetical protein